MVVPPTRLLLTTHLPQPTTHLLPPTTLPRGLHTVPWELVTPPTRNRCTKISVDANYDLGFTANVLNSNNKSYAF